MIRPQKLDCNIFVAVALELHKVLGVFLQLLA